MEPQINLGHCRPFSQALIAALKPWCVIQRSSARALRGCQLQEAEDSTGVLAVAVRRTVRTY